MAQTGKDPPAMQETWLPTLGWEDPLEEGMTTHSSILAWKISMVRGAWWATVQGVTKSWTQLKWLSPAQHKISKIIFVVCKPSPTQWTWVWVNCGSWWWTGRPGMLQSMEPQRVGCDWATELNWSYFLSGYSR